MKSRIRANGRRTRGRFSSIPIEVSTSIAWTSLRGSALKILWLLIPQYNGKNNGSLIATRNFARENGVTSSHDVLSRGLKQLIERGLIVQTRQGRKNVAALYAMTWESIDTCHWQKPSLDVAATDLPSHEWRRYSTESESDARDSGQLSPCSGPAKSSNG